MESKVIGKFTEFLKKNGIRQLFESCIKQYGHSKNYTEYVQNDCDDPILAVAQAFEYDKMTKCAVDFKLISKRWEMICIRNRYDQKVNELISAYGENEVIDILEKHKKEGKFFLYSFEYLLQQQQQQKGEEEKPKEEEKSIVKAHLVNVKPKKEFIPESTDDFEFIKFKKVNQLTDLDDYSLFVNNSSKSRYIKFNNHISSLMVELGLTHLRVRLDKQTGDIHFIIQSSETDDSIECKTKNSKSTYYLNNKAVVEWLSKKLNKTEERYNVSVTKNLSKNNSFITIKINQ